MIIDESLMMEQPNKKSRNVWNRCLADLVVGSSHLEQVCMSASFDHLTKVLND